MSGGRAWFFLRGLIRESGHWSGFLETFRAAFPGDDVVALDIPGNGIRFREASPTTIAGNVTAVRDEFLARRKSENFLFALSLGAMVGLEWMHQHPGDFQGAVLVNSSLRGLSPLHHRLRPRNYGIVLRLLLSPGNLALRERKILEMTSESRERFAQLERDWVDIQRAHPVGIGNALRQLLAAARFRPPPERPTAKLLILNGARDGLVAPSCSKVIASHWDVPLSVHPEAGHDLTLDQPAWVVDQVRARFY